jgi:hypothetical protein
MSQQLGAPQPGTPPRQPAGQIPVPARLATAAGRRPPAVQGVAAATGTRRPGPAGEAPSRPAADVTLAAVRSAPGRVDAKGTMLRLRALHVMGHGSARIARASGVGVQMIQRVTRGEARTVSQVLRDAVTQVYDHWWDKRPPERTRWERAAATTARRRARHGDWCAGAALDDSQLDQPGYQPPHGWLPASGTGVAGQPGATVREGIA